MHDTLFVEVRHRTEHVGKHFPRDVFAVGVAVGDGVGEVTAETHFCNDVQSAARLMHSKSELGGSERKREGVRRWCGDGVEEVWRRCGGGWRGADVVKGVEGRGMGGYQTVHDRGEQVGREGIPVAHTLPPPIDHK